jgi:O-antigen/teichoic acid export membrane protein
MDKKSDDEELKSSGVPDAGLRPRLQAGITFNLVGAVFNQGSTFLFNIIAANLLGKQSFGKYGMVQSTLVTLSQVAQFACGYTATKYIAQHRSNDKEKTGRILSTLLTVISGCGLAVSTCLLAAVPWLANSILKAPDLKIGLAIGAGVVFLSVLNGFLLGAFAGLESYRKLSIALVWSGTFYLVSCAMLTWIAGLNGAFLGLLLSALFQWILLRRGLKSECGELGIRFRYRIFPEGRSILLRFALPAAVSGLTFLPALWFGNAFLVRQPEGYARMALFSAAYTLMTAVLFIPNITGIVGWSILNHHKGQGQTGLYRRTLWINLAIAGIAVLAGAAVLALLGPEILRLFGKNFSDGYPVLLIMLGAAIPQALALAVYQHLQSQERMWLSFFVIVLPRDMLLATLAYILVPRYGAAGLACAYLAAWTAALFLITSVVLFTNEPAVDASLSNALKVPEELASRCP